MKDFTRISWLVLVVVFSFFFFSCNRKNKTEDNFATRTDSLKLNYATGFAVYYHDDFKEVIVYNPWEKGKEYAHYYLVENNNVSTPLNGTRIVVPLKTIAVTSTTHLEFFNLLDEIGGITGVCSPELIYNHKIQNGVKAKQIEDLGDAFSMNIEKTLTLNPQALMTSGYNQNDPNVLRISQANIPVLYNNEWMETSLLGRAEWIKFVSVFYNKEQVADSIFASVESGYIQARNKVKHIAEKPKVMSGSNFRGTWYMPAGGSFMGKLFAEAGADYYYAKEPSSGSLPLSIETVIMNFSDSDVWLNCSYNSIDELLRGDDKHALFRPVKQRAVYNFNKLLLPSGANDFWESAVARPDLLLNDVIAILHPTILPDYKLIYASRLD